MRRYNHAGEEKRCHLAALEKPAKNQLSSDYRSLGNDSTCNIQWDKESNMERAINISRKNITDGDYEAEEDQRSGEPPPEPPCLETFIDCPPARAYSGRNPRCFPPHHDGVSGTRKVSEPQNLCGEQRRLEGQPVHVAVLLAGGARHRPDLVMVFSIALQH